MVQYFVYVPMVQSIWDHWCSRPSNGPSGSSVCVEPLHFGQICRIARGPSFGIMMLAQGAALSRGVRVH